MKIIAFNGSPRKGWNTATLLGKALEGAASHGAETEMIHLVDFDYKGCMSCFSCKLKNGDNYGRCGIKDALTPILKKVEETDGFILGASIYLGAVNSMTHAFLERFLYPFVTYDVNHSILFQKKIPTGCIYTMGVSEERMIQMGYDQPTRMNQMMLERIFGSSESLLVTDTYQFNDYSKYETSGIDVEEKTRVRKEVFPEECRKAYEMGVKIAEKVM